MKISTIATIALLFAFNVINAVDYTKLDAFLQKYVSAQGNVNYNAIHKNPSELNAILKTTFEANVPKESWSKNEKLAYWINAYNAYTIKLIIDNYPLKSIKDISNPWGQDFIKIGGKAYSLENIEHEILRKMGEPRIHFAINCASFSCPNLLNKAFFPATLDKQLDMVTKSFINDKSKNTISANKIEVSKIFDWFKGDFDSYGGVVEMFRKYSDIELEKKVRVSYANYNWSLNK